jgi:SAM-dependent methyltransferase
VKDALEKSWGSLTQERAAEYLRTYGAPSEGSKRLTAEVLADRFGAKPFTLLDVGCGNAHVFGYLREAGLDVDYTGVDFSDPLLEVARSALAGDVGAALVKADANTLEGVDGHWDVALYSHVVEMLSSPEASLVAARRLADAILIRFFQPPEAEVDLVELREMEIGDGSTVPYLRRTMSRDYYRLILTKLGCTSVDVYRDETSIDQVHVLHYGDDPQSTRR